LELVLVDAIAGVFHRDYVYAQEGTEIVQEFVGEDDVFGVGVEEEEDFGGALDAGDV